ncbi:glycosyltransferase family 4 protein [Halosegnis sp.]|uniref:glycosyltransferase family 4 protein n=1 Tax=Halosegnis sp. TaxID=2864959 RepID=UPI0035D501B0
MRVAFVAFETSHRTGRQGSARTEALARGLAARGHDVTVFCSQWWYGADAGAVRVDDDVRYRRIDIAPTLTSSLLRLPGQLARYQPDVVHATPAPPAVLLAARAGAALARARLVCDWYGDEPVDGSRLAGPATQVADAYLVPSEFVRSQFRERGLTADRLTVLPEYIDLEYIRGIEPRSAGPDVVAGRHLDADANLESLFLGLAEQRDREWTAAVVGDGPARATFEQAAADLRIDDRVRFVGDISRAERIALYRGAHAFVHTARRESFAVELLWALACGCVGIVEYQQASAAHELVERRDRGFRVTSSEAIADALSEARALPHLTVDDDLTPFDREQVLAELVSVYR